jgi:hypothetical protein
MINIILNPIKRLLSLPQDLMASLDDEENDIIDE